MEDLKKKGVVTDMELAAKNNEMKYAGFWRRFFAYMFDGFLLGIPLLILEAILLIVFKEKGTIISNILTYLLTGAYFVIAETKFKMTVGKMLLGIQVVNKEGESISYKQAIIRFLGRIPSSFLMIGYILPIFRKDKRALHDLIAKTYVVKKSEAD